MDNSCFLKEICSEKRTLYIRAHENSHFVASKAVL